MQKFIKKFMAFILTFVLFISTTPINAYMSYAETLNPKEVKTATFSMSNPAYEGLDIKTYSPKIYNSGKSVNSTPTFNTIEDAGEYLRDQMIARNGTISVTINKSYYSNMHKDIFSEAVKDNGFGDSSAGDYLYWNWNGYNCNISYSGSTSTITYSMKYLSTASQEQAVDREVKNVLDNLNVYNKDPYQKILAVHDYIVENIDYDYSLENHSAYNAIVDKNVVCQGFASITSKMLKELNIGARVISGNDSTHGWNIVNIDSYWYNTDNTWDENLTTSSNICYDYFLKGSSDFYNHTRDSDFDTSSFHLQYPTAISAYKYVPSQKKSISSANVNVSDQAYTGSPLTPSVSVALNGTTLIEGTDYTVSYSNNTNIGTATVTINGIGNYTGSVTAYFSILAPSINKVSGLTFEESDTNSIKMSWDYNQDETRYQIYRTSNPYMEYELIADTANTYFIDTNLQENSTYYYKVRAYKIINSTMYYSPFSNVLIAQTEDLKETESSLNISNYNYPTKIVRGNSFSLKGTISSDSLIDYVRVEVLDENGMEVFSCCKDVYPYSYSFSDLDTGIKFGLLDIGTYTYRVFASDESGNEKTLIERDFSVVSPSVSVKNITGLKYTNTTSNTKLSWNKASSVSGYEVWMYKSSLGYYTKVKTISGSKTNYYKRTGLTSATMYRYKVRAYKTVNGVKYYGKFTNEFVICTKPLTPSVKISSPSSKKVKLTWTNTSSKTTGYQVYRATSKSGTYKKVKTTTSKSFTNTGLTKGKYYYYKVRAYRVLDNGEIVYGAFSSVKSVKVK